MYKNLKGRKRQKKKSIRVSRQERSHAKKVSDTQERTHKTLLNTTTVAEATVICKNEARTYSST